MFKLTRYNLRVVLANNWWLLVFPIAVSQLTVFWTIITRRFTPSLPVEGVELITPLLAAFLCSHVMTAEYHSRVGAILASKPLHINKVVLFRVTAVMALVWLLEMASLAAYYFGMEPYDVKVPFLVSIPSTLFLAMFALTFATLFRNALAGFGVAALYWAMDLAPGPPANPWLSLKSYTTFLTSMGSELDALVSPWWIAKILLLVAALALYLFHGRLVFGLGQAPSSKVRRRSLALAISVLCVYIVSGAAVKVVYGYTRRGSLEPNDGAWFRREFMPYGPLPVAYVFGPAFHRYLGDTNGWRPAGEEADRLGDTLKHHRGLREVVERMPGSIWAPSAAELLGRLSGRQGDTPEQRVAVFQHVADVYPNSPYVDVALREKAQILDGVERRDEARKEYEKLLSLRPNTRFRSEAMRYIVANDRAHNNMSGAVQWARKWVEVAQPEERCLAYLAIAEGLKEQGDTAGARDAANKTIQSAREVREALANETMRVSATARLKIERQAAEATERARKIIL